MSTVTIIGSGNMATAIAELAASAKHRVEVTSRDPAKAQALVERIASGATAGTFGTTPAGDIVILAVPYTAVLDVVKQYGDRLAGKLLIDITNPIRSDLSGFLTPEGSSGAQEIAKAGPGDATIVKAFNTLNSHALASSPAEGRLLDVFIAGDDAQAKTCVSTFVESFGLRPMDVGPLSMAWTLEHACMLWLGLMAHSIKHTNFSIGVSTVG